jgi:hypothetical protein
MPKKDKKKPSAEVVAGPGKSKKKVQVVAATVPVLDENSPKGKRKKKKHNLPEKELLPEAQDAGNALLDSIEGKDKEDDPPDLTEFLRPHKRQRVHNDPASQMFLQVPLLKNKSKPKELTEEEKRLERHRDMCCKAWPDDPRESFHLPVPQDSPTMSDCLKSIIEDQRRRKPSKYDRPPDEYIPSFEGLVVQMPDGPFILPDIEEFTAFTQKRRLSGDELLDALESIEPEEIQDGEATGIDDLFKVPIV